MNRPILLLFLILLICGAAAAGPARIDPWVVSHTGGTASAEVLVILKQQADLLPARALPRKVDRGRYVFATLLQNAERSQSSLVALLQSRHIEYRSFYIVNALLLRADRALVQELAARPDVERIEGNPVIHNDLPAQGRVPSLPSGVEPNISVVRAPEMWSDGITGQGIVIGGADTGYRWTHAALKNQYRGWNGTSADHDYNWHDAIHSGGGSCGADSTQPCDDFGHGTHTMGTALGDDGAGNQVGMAPGAKWIGCRNMDQGNGTPARYLECFEFFLAPYPVGGTPAQGDPSLAPDITTNSWSCPPSEGCSDLTLQSAVDAQSDAGILTVVSAGNGGPACGTVSEPAALYGSAYTVGATNNSDAMASFSSRGPAATTGLTKPDLVAPGVSVRSASNSSDTAYTTLSGTSMSAPNVAGAVALLWSGVPSLRNQLAASESVLDTNAVKLTAITEACGGDYTYGPNNTWGYGRLDIRAAYLAAIAPPACLFCDDFEDGVLAANWTYPAPSWSETAGSLVGIPSRKKAMAVAAPAFSGCLNCAVHTSFSTGGGTGNRVSLFAWYGDKDNNIELMMKQEDNRWILRQRAGGRIIAKVKYSAPISAGIAYAVDLSYGGAAFHFSIDGAPAISMTPVAAVSAGTVAFRVRNTTGSFNEIEVR